MGEANISSTTQEHLVTIEDESPMKREGNTAVIDEIQSHPFSFGMEAAISNPTSVIRFVDSQFRLIYTPPTISEPEWWGDCTLDARLTQEALKRAAPLLQTDLEYVYYDFPEVSYRGSHTRVKVIDSQGEPVPLEHSRFFSNLSKDRSHQYYPDEVPLRESLNEMALDYYRNYKEFVDGDREYLMELGVTESQDRSNVIVISVRVFEQDPEGKLTRGFISRNEINTSTISDQVSVEDVQKNMHFSSVLITQNGETKLQELRDGHIKTEIISCFTNTINACLRGRAVTVKTETSSVEK